MMKSKQKSRPNLYPEFTEGKLPPTHAHYLAGPAHGIIYLLKLGSSKYRTS